MRGKEELKARRNLEHLFKGYFHVEKVDDKKLKKAYLSIMKNKIVDSEEKQYHVEDFKERYTTYHARLKWIKKD